MLVNCGLCVSYGKGLLTEDQLEDVWKAGALRREIDPGRLTAWLEEHSGDGKDVPFSEVCLRPVWPLDPVH